MPQLSLPLGIPLPDGRGEYYHANIWQAFMWHLQRADGVLGMINRLSRPDVLGMLANRTVCIQIQNRYYDPAIMQLYRKLTNTFTVAELIYVLGRPGTFANYKPHRVMPCLWLYGSPAAATGPADVLHVKTFILTRITGQSDTGLVFHQPYAVFESSANATYQSDKNLEKASYTEDARAVRAALDQFLSGSRSSHPLGGVKAVA
jgi:hypothetical protein